MMIDMPPPFDAAWFRFLLGAIVGAALGSFGTMLAYRMPRRMSIVFPASHCPSCKTPLRILDLFPIASWVFNRGKCRHCHAKIGARYVLIEIAVSFMCGVMGIAVGCI